MRVPMDAFDQFIIETLSNHLFSNQRVREMLLDLMERQAIRRYEKMASWTRSVPKLTRRKKG